MKLFCHVLNSWLLAIAFVLGGLFVYELINTYSFLSGDLLTPGLFVVPFAALLVALPSLFLGLLFLRFIQTTQYTVIEKFILWCLAALMAIIFNIVFIAVVFAPEMFEPGTFLILWPAYPAVIISLSVRYKYFLLLHTGSIENEEHIV